MGISDYIAAGAAFISVVACSISIWQASLSKKHNLLSIRPMLHYDCGIVDNDLILIIKNTGMGPAIIKSWSVKFNGISLGNNAHEISVKLFEELEVEHLGGDFYLPGKGQAMAAGTNYRILKIKGLALDKETQERLVNELTLLTINFSYESIYGETFNISGPEFN
jgi:hypothetical protein